MRKLALLSATAALAIVPATAAAERIKHVGGLAGKGDSKVRLRVTTKQGKLYSVGGIKARGGLIRCASGDLDLRFRVRGAIAINRADRFRARVRGAGNRRERLRVSGRVKADGSKVVGVVSSDRLTQNGERCVVPEQRFVTRRR